MFEIGLVFFGLALNAAVVVNPDWLELIGGAATVLLVNVVFFMWLGLKVAFTRRLVMALRQDVVALNEQTVKMNVQISDLEGELKNSEELANDAKDQAISLKTQVRKREEELEFARQRQAQAEKMAKEMSNAQASPEEAEAELVQFLGLLQKHGRFLDFVMGDISRYPDDRVGAAARLVHQGCSKAMRDYFDVKPILEQDEGSQIQLESQDNPRKVRLIGQTGDESPKQGRLIHRGWQTMRVALPKRTRLSELDRVIIAPAEIEVRN